MRLRELNFPILICHPNELEGGRGARLHSPVRFNWTLAEVYRNGSYDEVEIVDADGQAYRVKEIYFMRPTVWRRFLERLDNLLILPSLERREIVRVDMELEPTRKLDLEQFRTEFRNLILAHPAWWKRFAGPTEMEQIFSSAESLAEAINEIGYLAPSYNMVYRGKSKKIVDLR